MAVGVGFRTAAGRAVSAASGSRSVEGVSHPVKAAADMAETANTSANVSFRSRKLPIS